MRPTRPPPRPHPGCRRIRSSIDGDPSFSIHLSLCSTDFHQLPRSYEEIRLLHAHRHSRRCLLPAYRSRGPMQISQGKDTECTAAPGLNTAPISVGFRASRSLARSPDRPGLSKASLAFGAAACLRLLPHTASRRQGLGVSRRRSLHAVAFSSRLLPTRSAEDFHLQSSAHAWHTKPRAFGAPLRASGLDRSRDRAVPPSVPQFPPHDAPTRRDAILLRPADAISPRR